MLNFSSLFALMACLPMSVMANPFNAPYAGPGYYAPPPAPYQSNRNSGFGEWKNWMQNQLQGRNWQQGDGNIFKDAKGFYKWMGNGNTRYKFYFNVDFQVEMDAWLRAKNRQNARNNLNHQQRWHHQGQAAPGYLYRGHGYYQGQVYPQGGYPPYAPHYPLPPPR